MISLFLQVIILSGLVQEGNQATGLRVDRLTVRRVQRARGRRMLPTGELG